MEHLLIYPAAAAFVAVMVAGFLFKGRPLQGDLLDRFEGLARTVKGTLDPGTWFRWPRLRFDSSGCPGTITWFRSGRTEQVSPYHGSSLNLELIVSGLPAGNLKIWSKSRPWHPRVGRPWGCPRVVVGDPAVDAEFVIRSSPAAVAEWLFAPERRETTVPLIRGLVGDDALSLRGGVLRTSFSVDSLSPSGISAVVSEARKLTALLRELPT